MIPTLSELEAMHAAGRLPADLAQAVNIREAARLAALLPPVLRRADDLVEGYGLLPPQGAEPLVRVRKRARPLLGRIITPGSWGVVGALWRGRGGRVVFRLWFRSDDSTALGMLRGPVDVYEDAIAAVRTLNRDVPRLTGWQVARLDTPSTPAAGSEGLVGRG